jgi:predicted house-cleaning noncanonical NTP pyrophosphatase (MazG superfamily)
MLPQKIADEKGATLHYRVMDANEYLIEIKKKLIEEAMEVNEAQTEEEVKEELADVLEVFLTCIKTLGFSQNEIDQVRLERKNDRGGFDKKIYSTFVEVTEEYENRLNYYLKNSQKYPEIHTLSNL